MSRGVNKVILIGGIGADPEVRYAPSGTPIANMNLATTDIWKDRQSGQRQERTEWHRLVLFNNLASLAEQYVTKGSKIYVEGRLQTRKWQDQNGQDRYNTEIVVNDMQFLGGGRNAPQQPAQGQQHQQQPQQPQQPAQGQPHQQQPQQPQQAQGQQQQPQQPAQGQQHQQQPQQPAQGQQPQQPQQPAQGQQHQQQPQQPQQPAPEPESFAGGSVGDEIPFGPVHSIMGG